MDNASRGNLVDMAVSSDKQGLRSAVTTLLREPRPWPGALAQDSAPRAYWKVPRAYPWGSTLSLLPNLDGGVRYQLELLPLLAS